MDARTTSLSRTLRDSAWKLWTLVRRVFTFRKGVILLYRHKGKQELRLKDLPFEIRRVEYSNVEDALSLDSPPVIDLFRRFLEDGNKGYYAYMGNEVVHRSWVKFGPNSVETWHCYAPFRLQPGQAVIHYCRTAVKARGRGIYPTVLSRIVDDCHEAGIKDIFTATALDNVASQRGIEKAGFIEIERKSVKVFFGVPFYQLLFRLDCPLISME